MNRILKMSVLIGCIIAGSSMFADAKTQTVSQPDKSINTVALALKAPSDTVVSITGKLIVIKKKVYLQDSTGKIAIAAPRFQLEVIAEDAGMKVTVTGKVTKSIWSRLGFKDPTLTVANSNSVTETALSKSDVKK